MKTIIKKVFGENEPASSYIRRTGNGRAQVWVDAGEWAYASKSLWKEKIRDIKKEKTISKSKKKSKAKEKN